MSKDDIAIDTDGSVAPLSAEDVRKVVDNAIQNGTVLAVVLRDPSGQIAVQVFGPPSEDLLSILETTAAAYRRAMLGRAH